MVKACASFSVAQSASNHLRMTENFRYWPCSNSVPMLQAKPPPYKNPPSSLSLPFAPSLCCRAFPSRWTLLSPAGASGKGGVRDGVCRVTGEGHGDGVARPPRHPLHAMEVLRAGREEGDSSWAKKEWEGLFRVKDRKMVKRSSSTFWEICLFCRDGLNSSDVINWWNWSGLIRSYYNYYLLETYLPNEYTGYWHILLSWYSYF